jgi:hypothetical protein
VAGIAATVTDVEIIGGKISIAIIRTGSVLIFNFNLFTISLSLSPFNLFFLFAVPGLSKIEENATSNASDLHHY